MNLKNLWRSHRKQLLHIFAQLLVIIAVILCTSYINRQIDVEIERTRNQHEIFSYLTHPKYLSEPETTLDADGNTAVIAPDAHHYSTWTFFYWNGKEDILDQPLREVNLPDGRSANIYLTTADLEELKRFSQFRPGAHKFGVRTIWLQGISDFAPINTHHMCIDHDSCVVTAKLNRSELEKIIAQLQSFPTFEEVGATSGTPYKIIEDDIFMPDACRFRIYLSLDVARQLLDQMTSKNTAEITYYPVNPYDYDAAIARSSAVMYADERKLAADITAAQCTTLWDFHEAKIEDLHTRRDITLFAAVLAVIVICFPSEKLPWSSRR